MKDATLPFSAARTALLAALFLLASAELYAEETPSIGMEPSSDGIRTVAVFTYLDPSGSLAPEQAFARFAVPDVIRLTLMEDPDLILIEKSAIDAALAANPRGGPAADSLEGEEARRGIARDTGADHYIWGYLVPSAGHLAVLQFVVDVESGKTIHMRQDAFADGQAIFDEVAASARSFASWVRSSIPPRAVEPIVIVKEIPVETPVERTVDRIVERLVPVEISPRDRATLGIGASALVFAGSLAPSLMPTGEFGLAFAFGRSPSHPLRFGLRTEMALIRQTASAPGGSITVLEPSLAGLATWPIELGRELSFVPEFDAGATMVFGKVNDSLVAYLRPRLGLEASLAGGPLPTLPLAIGVRFSAVFWAWGNETLWEILPFARAIFRI